MISVHGTETLFTMRFEILGLVVATLMTGHVNGEYRYISLTRLPDGKISIFSDVSDGN